MKKQFAVTLLILYLFSSSGFVLVEYSCSASGLSGMSMRASADCHVPSCGQDVTSGVTALCSDDSCCDVEVRTSSQQGQVTSRSGDTDARTHAPDARVVAAAISALTAIEPQTSSCHPPFTGFERPLRI
jgi:hypothetical protein